MELTKYIKPYRVQFSIGSLAKLIEALLELYLPILMAKILDVGIPNRDKSYIIKIGLQILGLAVLGFSCASVCQYFAAITSQSTGASLREALVEKISTFSYKELDMFGTSTLTNRITTDVNNYQQMIALIIRLATRSPFIGIGAIIMSLLIDPKLAIIFICLIPILTLIIILFTKLTSPLFRKAQLTLDRFALIVRENLIGIRVIRAFANTDQETKKAHKAASVTSEAYSHVGSIFSLMQPLNSVFLNAGIILVLFFGARRIFIGKISQGDILSLTIYANKVLYALLTISTLVVTIIKGSVSGKRIAEVLVVEPSIVDNKEKLTTTTPSSIYLQFNNVSFSYSKSAELLDNINFSVEKGSTVGIVGVTGSGKSTLLDLIQRFYDPNFGEITINGFNIKNISQETLRKKIGVVPQKNILFSGTIMENMKVSNQSATENEIVDALKTSQCWDFIESLPNKINSPIFEGGKNFSGGQKQRLAIARALVKNPEILLLDDSLSALDYKTDYELRKSIKTKYPNLTTIIVSQRISSVIGADKIAVLDHGKLVGFDTHQELLKICKPYQDIYNSQVDEIDKEVYDEK